MRYSTSSNFLRFLLIHILAVAPLWLTAQENAHLLSVDELFRLGTENSLQLKKSKLQEVIYNDQKKSAYTDRLPDIQVGASACHLSAGTFTSRAPRNSGLVTKL